MSDKVTGWDLYLWVMSAMCGALISFGFTTIYWKKESVKHGCAEYYLDENHERQWRWK